MRLVVLCFALSISSVAYSQQDERISTMDFVQVLNDNKEETIYYYQNNWKLLRDLAIKKDYIHSYQLLETTESDDAPFQLILITTYKNQEQYDQREDNFGKLIEARGDLRLLNDKKPGDFRKIIFGKDRVRHLH